jgi:hypothetical protein
MTHDRRHNVSLLIQLSGAVEKHVRFLRIPKCKSPLDAYACDASRLSKRRGPVTSAVDTDLSLAIGLFNKAASFLNRLPSLLFN